MFIGAFGIFCASTMLFFDFRETKSHKEHNQPRPEHESLPETNELDSEDGDDGYEDRDLMNGKKRNRKYTLNEDDKEEILLESE